MPPTSRQERRRPYLKSGIYALRNAVLTLGARALPPKSTALGRALHEWRQALLADLGGVDTVSTQQLALVDLAVRTKLLVDSVDSYTPWCGSAGRSSDSCSRCASRPDFAQERAQRSTYIVPLVGCRVLVQMQPDVCAAEPRQRAPLPAPHPEWSAALSPHRHLARDSGQAQH